MTVTSWIPDRHRRVARCGWSLLVVAALLAAAPTLGTAPVGADGNEAPGAPAAARSLSAGGDHTCALLDNGRVKCWGRSGDGQLGQDGTAAIGDQPGEMATLAPVNLGAGATASAVAAGNLHTCALLDDGSVKCWGRNQEGQLGQGSTERLGDEPGEMAALTPVDLGAGRTATAVTAGGLHTCALLDDASVKCWGFSDFGQLGQGSTETLGDEPGEMAALAPVDLGAGRTATAISAGQIHTCALLDDGSVKCWGTGDQGRLGQGSTAHLGDEPGEMAALGAVDLGAGRTATAVTAGNFHTCALLDDGSVKCWGPGSHGRLGQGGTDDLGDEPGEIATLAPVDLGTGRSASAVTAGGFHTCALLDDGTVKCWGRNNAGQLGRDSSVNVGDAPGGMAGLGPVNLGGGRTATAVTTGTFHTCALLDDARVKCWGMGTLGRLGQGSTDNVGDQPGSMAALGPIVLGRAAGVGARGRPDGHLRLGSGTFAGRNTYNTTGVGQTRAATVAARGTARFTVRVENDGTYTDRYRVRAQGATNRYAVTYRRGTTNITNAVRGGGFVTPELRPGQSLNLTVTIQAKAAARRGDRVERVVTITSLGETARKDAVRARVARR